ncbi:hypothetical protein [Yersinia mollaretii]|uniref:hypothetical protein n=1 Tax=Yersinia mollaretii TaxID=33060 RepID=UPI0011A01B2A|nr:hypothetical protein [Yersinia mollaretii]MDN0110114.1 hypothetical protein [Yersinia mollaretii]
MKRLLFTFLLVPAYQTYAAECSSDETMIASCTLSGKMQRVAAFCTNEKTDTLYYVFRNGEDIELKVDFSESRKLKRWVDKWTYTTYFGFSQGKYDYVLGVPEEKPNAVAFLNIKKDGESVSIKNCNFNSFGEKDIKNNSIDDVSDSSVRNNGFKFP